MELEVTIHYRNSSACYKIKNEREGIFTASLLYYEGDSKVSFPDGVTLVKGIRYWTGSVDDQILLGELGKCIDANWPTMQQNHI